MDMQSLQERFDFLREGGQTSVRSEEKTKEIIKGIEERFSLEFSEDFGGMFITHILLFIERAYSGDEFQTELPMEHEEIKACSEQYDYMKEWMDTLALQLGTEFPEAEISFLTAHLVQLLGLL